MTAEDQLIDQTKLAFDFLQKLYLEVSYLIKETEGLLYEEEERFVIGKPSGYGISSRSSTGLESNSIGLWLLRKFAVFFVSEDKTTLKKGQTVTPIDENLKVIYLRIVLNDKDLAYPAVYSGVLYNIQQEQRAERIKKFENMMGHFQYKDPKVFVNFKKIDYEDPLIKCQGELVRTNLFMISDSESILNKIIRPSLNLYRKY
jgi:hypothetical protein